MACLIKTRPLAVELGQEVSFSEKAFFAGPREAPGDDAFVWFSETQGGNGLAFRGRVIERTPEHVRVLLEERPRSKLGNEVIRPWQGSRERRPEAELAHKIYGHAHNKITSLQPETAAFITAFF